MHLVIPPTSPLTLLVPLTEESGSFVMIMAVMSKVKIPGSWEANREERPCELDFVILKFYLFVYFFRDSLSLGCPSRSIMAQS